MNHRKRHIHDWQWSEQQNRYLCHCGESLLSEDAAQPVAAAEGVVLPEKREPIIVDPRLVQHICYSCLGSGYSDYAIGQPCAVCGGWGYWEGIV